MKPKIVVVGSSNTDMIVKLKRLPKPGETILGGQFVTAAGGKGANQAVGATRAGGAVTFIARVGGDSLGEQALRGFRRDRINVDYIVKDEASPSGVALIFVAQDGENSIAVAAGANARLSPADVKRAAEVFTPGGTLLLQLETPLATVQAAAELAVARGMRVILNPAPARRLPVSLLRHVAVLTPNASEAELLTGIDVRKGNGATTAARALLARGVQAVAITLGARGALVAAGESSSLVSGFKVKPVDATAAGDIFNGALAVALGEARPLLAAVRFANAAAALSVTRLGAQPSAPTRPEIEELLARDRAPQH